MTNYWFEWHEMFKICMIHVQCPNDQRSIVIWKITAILFRNIFYISIQRVHFNEETYKLRIVTGIRNEFEWHKFIGRENI